MAIYRLVITGIESADKAAELEKLFQQNCGERDTLAISWEEDWVATMKAKINEAPLHGAPANNAANVVRRSESEKTQVG